VDVARAIAPIPAAAVLGDFAIAAPQNSRRLLTDAENLLKRGGWPSAYSLAVLAFEEVGKAWVSMIALLTPPQYRDQLPFDDMIRSHLDKLQAARSLAALLRFIESNASAVAAYIEAIEAMEGLAREDNLAKQRGFYVDCQDGVIWSPSGISRDEARRMVATLDRGAPLIETDFISFMTRLQDDERSDLDIYFADFFRALDESEPEAAVTAVASYLSRLEGLPEMLEQDARRLALERSRQSRTQVRERSRAQRRGKSSG
jgi:AbiV family abortive infection protein